MKAKQRGMSLVELLVGLTIGLFIVAAASTLMLGQLREHKRLTVETQTQQELRAIGELLRRELMQAGAWARADDALWTPNDLNPMPNPYSEVLTSEDGTSLSFWASQAAVGDATASAENHSADAADRKAFRLKGKALEYLTDGGSFQPLNDPATLAITAFKVSLQTVSYREEALCPKPCDGLTDCPPEVTQRHVRVVLKGQAAADAAVKRNLDFSTRLPADVITGRCRA